MIRFELPDELSATEPPEAHGLRRDEVRLLVVDGDRVEHTSFKDIGRFLRPGDVLVVNTSATLPAAVDAVREDGAPVVVHFSTAKDDRRWIVEIRTAVRAERPVLDARECEVLTLAGGGVLQLLARATSRSDRLWFARFSEDVEPMLRRDGRPIRYGYVPDRWPLEQYQTVFARDPGSAEMPSAARPFTAELVTSLVSQGVVFAPVTLHTGVSSLEPHEEPLRERTIVSETTAQLINNRSGRVIAVGTTSARAVESATDETGVVHPMDGWTDLVLSLERPARLVDGLVTGMHAPDASHLLLLEAVAGAVPVRRAYDAALERGYLWHEFGDVSLLLPQR